MSSIRIDLQHGSCVPRGHDMFQQLVGAHMVAQTEEELDLMVAYSMNEILGSGLQQAVCLSVDGAYDGQAAVLGLLDLATRQRIAFEDAGLDADPYTRDLDPDRFDRERVQTWQEVRDDPSISNS